MKTKKYCLFTSIKNKMNFKEYDIYSLMIQAGFIRKICSGIFILLPNGLQIINNIINIIRNKMNLLNSLELNLPIIVPSNLWIRSSRIYSYGSELYKIYDRNNKLFILSPTSEEVITKFFLKEKYLLNNYPYIFYQINYKFRDEIRPKAGIIRSKEFLMKDAYSFHKSKSCLDKIYIDLLNIYIDIFKELKLDVFYKEAKCGKIGGALSHEFHTNSIYGENYYYIKKIDIIKNFYNIIIKKNKIKKFKIRYFNTKIFNKLNILENIKLYKFIKTNILKIYFINKIIYIVVLISYYKIIDLMKIKDLFPLSIKIKILNDKNIIKKFNISNLFLGPFTLNYRIIADFSLINYKNFIIGANIKNCFFYNVNWIQHINIVNFIDISKNICFKSKNIINKNSNIVKFKSLEIAHIFKLYNIYTLNYDIKNIYMGCYGIGIFRLLTSILEKNLYNNKIVLPLSITYFKIGIIPVLMFKNKNVFDLSFKIYYFLIKNNINVLIENRNIYIAKTFNDFEIIGIPNFLIISKNLLFINKVEFRDRINNTIYLINIKEIYNFLLKKYIY